MSTTRTTMGAAEPVATQSGHGTTRSSASAHAEQPERLPAPEGAIRVLMITTEWPTPGRAKTSNFIKRQANFLRAAGVAVDVLHFEGAKKLRNYLAAWARAHRALKRGAYDLVHAQFGQSGLVAFPKRIPLVVTFRGSDLLGQVGDPSGRHTWSGKVLRLLSRMVARQADAVIVVSEHMRAHVPPSAPVSVIPSGLDLETFKCAPREEARRRLQLPLTGHLILFVGRTYEARKRYGLAQQAVQLLNRSLAAELIVAWGVPHVEIPWYMSACDALVFTSVQEGSPNVVKEALACDLPVVSVRVGDVAQRLAGIAGCELCEDERPETIAAALERALRRGARVNGRDAVRQLDEHVLTKKVIDVYRSVLPSRARHGVLVREAVVEERNRWDELVQGFPNYRVVHSRAWLDSLEASGKGQVLYLVFEKDGEIAGCLPGLVARVGPLRVFGSPLPGWQSVSMGPVFDPARLSTSELIAAAVPFLESRYGVHHIELMNAELDHAAMAGMGFRGSSVPTYRVPLYPGDEARTLKALKDSARRNIRRAVKLGLVVQFEESERFVDEHYEQTREVFVHGGHTVSFSKRRALELFRHMKAAGSLVAVSVYLPDRTTNIATGMFTIDGRELLLWMWAHRLRYRWYRPTELMTWTVMQRAMAAGCEVFDLMGRGCFKQKFGATLDTTKYRWVRSRYRWLTLARDLAQRLYRWQQAIGGRIVRLVRSASVGGEPSDEASAGGERRDAAAKEAP